MNIGRLIGINIRDHSKNKVKTRGQEIMEIATDDSFMLICFISIVAMGIMITLIGNCLCCRRNKPQK